MKHVQFFFEKLFKLLKNENNTPKYKSTLKKKLNKVVYFCFVKKVRTNYTLFYLFVLLELFNRD